MTDQARKIMLGTAGHVDHGKTSLVKLLTGCDTDRLKEEKQRGLTIELGYAPCKMADPRIAGIIDAPGHVDFIRNMASAAHAVDLAIICIAADDGIMPQTVEHVNIMSLMGVNRGVIALTRSDLVDQRRIDEVSAEITEFLKTTLLADSPIVPLSNITGDGFGQFTQTLLDQAKKCTPRRPAGDFRMWIDRVFSVEGFGTVITGIPTTASVKIGDKLSLAGESAQYRVRKLQAYGRDVEAAHSGQCAAINLADAPVENFHRGQVIASRPDKLHSMIEVCLSLLPNACELEDYTKVHVHIGSAHSTASVAILDKNSILPGQSALVQLRLDNEIPASCGESMVLRTQQQNRPLTTIAGARVLDTCGRRLKRRRLWTIEKLNRRLMSLDSPKQWILTILSEEDKSIVPNRLAAKCQMGLSQLEPILQALTEEGKITKLSDSTIFAAENTDKLAERFLSEIELHHKKTSQGSTLAQCCTNLGFSAALCEFLSEKCKADGKLTESTDSTGRQIFLPADSSAPKGPTLDSDSEKLEAMLKQSGIKPELPQDICEKLGWNQSQFDIALAKLAAAGLAVKLDRKVVMHTEAISQAKQAALELFRQQNFFETAQFRDELNTSRKYAIAILDWLDTQKFTTRNGPFRRPGAAAKVFL